METAFKADMYSPSRIVLSGPAYDLDFQNYLDRAAVLGLTATSANKAVGNALFVGLKADGLWTNISELYLIDMFDSFSSTWPKAKYVTNPTISFVNFVSGDYNRTTGLVGNGTSKYGNLNHNGAARLMSNSHACFYGSGFATSVSYKFTMGGYDSGGASAPIFWLLESDDPNGRRASMSTSGETATADISYTTSLSASGLVLMTSVAGNDFRVFEGTTQRGLNTNTRTGPGPNSNIGLFQILLAGAPIGVGYSSARLSKASVGLGLTSGQVTSYNSRLSTYTTGLT